MARNELPANASVTVCSSVAAPMPGETINQSVGPVHRISSHPVGTVPVELGHDEVRARSSRIGGVGLTSQLRMRKIAQGSSTRLGIHACSGWDRRTTV